MTEPAGGLRQFEKSLPIALLRAREATMRRFKPHVDAHGLTIQQWRVIRALADSGPLDSKTLAGRCVILPPSLTRIFRALRGKGLIRAAKVADGRRHAVELTEAGRALYADMAITSEAIYREIEDAFGTARMERLLELLTELRRVTEAMGPVQTPDSAPIATAAR
ncbi:homoprotocatechuate degradation operon regulator HpaR [Pikeienuella piscinae]|uniref:Homoprotocatechuate degradation operon regulator HpaR n=1 Tax=Pikeienuella piscinae TaxID=2748098 RepID=A0A7M3T5S6_9RHOB|nr:homoprotocatechuate degradation operon regulator HpaR [Pikeienuella piscinae]QIE57357.1 homoprotocatechuate degradation operon regulator HpaR [Pikeienuella piscinae]